MRLSGAARAAIAEAMRAAPWGARTAEARRLAGIYGVSVSTVYAAAELRGAKRARAAARPEYRDWTRIAVRYAELAPGRASLDQALDAAVKAGALPAEAAAMPVATARRIARDMGLTRKRKRTFRLAADYPMQAVLFDGSSTGHLVVKERLGDGDYLLELYSRRYRVTGYKNKPLGPDRLKALTYGIWDMCTGYTRAVYVVGRGESAVDGAHSLCAMLEETGDPLRPLHGVPDDLWADQGPLVKGEATRGLLERLNIAWVPGPPEAKERMGGVERPWRTLWQRFERSLFLTGKKQFTLSEIAERLIQYERDENGARDSRTDVGGRRASRTAAWIALTNARPADNRLRKLPEDPMRTLAQERECHVDNNGQIRWDRKLYEVERLHDCWVKAVRAADGSGGLVVTDAKGRQHAATLWQPRPYGEIRAAPRTPLEKLVEEIPAGDLPGADVYAGREAPAGVAMMPVRSAPAAALDNPLEIAERVATVDEGLELFYRHCPVVLTPAQAGRIPVLIEELDCSRAAIVELAQRVTAAAG